MALGDLETEVMGREMVCAVAGVSVIFRWMHNLVYIWNVFRENLPQVLFQQEFRSIGDLPSSSRRTLTVPMYQSNIPMYRSRLIIGDYHLSNFSSRRQISVRII
jgi:hypothetical protein